jgi:hypothetical protein
MREPARPVAPFHTAPLLAGLVLAGLAPRAAAQGPAFQTPGMPGSGIPGTPAMLGQTTRFSNEFNPAMGFVVDTLFDYASFEEPGAQDGFDASLRLFEFTGAAWIDPKAWAYTVVAAEGESEGIGVEEAALNYIGFGSHWNVKAGRFFVDFGKQMQSHVHDLRTVERPLVLRTYLGDELSGDGVEIGNWHAIGDESALRYSVGIFGSSLLVEGEEDGSAPTPDVAERQDFDELNFTGRLTGFTDVGSQGMLQAGGSARWVPQYSASDPNGVLADVQDLDSAVLGLDLTYGWTSGTGVSRWATGLEWLWSTGDTGVAFDDPVAPTVIQVFDETVTGYLAWFDYGFDQFNSAGVQWSQVELPESGKPDASELELYYTRGVSEFQRLRLVVTLGDDDSIADGEYVRAAIQYTAFLGAHSHGINW